VCVVWCVCVCGCLCVYVCLCVVCLCGVCVCVRAERLRPIVSTVLRIIRFAG